MASSHFQEDLRRFGPGGVESKFDLPAARAYCRSLTLRHYENFTVASWLLPKQYRQDVCNIYAYCRWSDDLADEPQDRQERVRLLEWWRGQLEDAFQGIAVHPVFVALVETLRERRLPSQPFRNLLLAFERDQRQTRYATAADLLTYCEHSANPVGRLYLHLTGQAFDEHFALSDSICTGLQWANFCQDVANDWERGRIYLPQETWSACGCSESDFAGGRCTDALRRVLRREVDRAEELLRGGQKLPSRVTRETRVPIELFARGGLAVLQRIRDQGYDVWSQRPAVSSATKLQLALTALVKAQLASWL